MLPAKFITHQFTFMTYCLHINLFFPFPPILIYFVVTSAHRSELFDRYVSDVWRQDDFSPRSEDLTQHEQIHFHKPVCSSHQDRKERRDPPDRFIPTHFNIFVRVESHPLEAMEMRNSSHPRTQHTHSCLTTVKSLQVASQKPPNELLSGSFTTPGC